MGQEWYGNGAGMNGQMAGPSSRSRSHPISSSAASGTYNCISHPVSKFDTLAGVAIKYGVEVSEIKRLNGLTADFQIFALKTLQIPLYGRHPPSFTLSNGDYTPQRICRSSDLNYQQKHSDFLDSFQSPKLKSSSDQKCYPPIPNFRQPAPDQRAVAGAGEGDFQMQIYRIHGVSHVDDGHFSTSSSASYPPMSHPRRSKSIANGLLMSSGNHHPHLLHSPDHLLSQQSELISTTDIRSADGVIRRRQKPIPPDFSWYPQKKVLKEENGGAAGNVAVSAVTGKQVAVRSRSGNSRPAYGESGSRQRPSRGDAYPGDIGVWRSSSVSSFGQDNSDSNNNPLAPIWPTSVWNLKVDFQAISSAAMPIFFDGLQRPAGRLNKSAID